MPFPDTCMRSMFQCAVHVLSTCVAAACSELLITDRTAELLLGATQSFFSVNVQDEYDPARPNDYEEIRRARERQRVDAEREAERQEELRAQKAAQEVGSYTPSQPTFAYSMF